MKVGAFSLTYVDLEVPVSGIPIALLRTYDSRDKRLADFGFGWTLDVLSGSFASNRKPGDGWFVLPTDDILFPIPCSIVEETKYHVTEVRFSDTEFYRFRLQVQMFGFGSVIAGGCLGEASFVQTGGVPGATLQILDETDVFWPNFSNEVQYSQSSSKLGQTYDPDAVRLTTLDRRQFDLTLEDGLTRFADANDNTLVISRGSIVHSSGKSVSISRDSLSRITAITDPLGNSLTYTYDALSDLTAVTDRGGNTTTYAYASGHLLTDIIDPLGNIPVRNEYDADGRLIAQIDADGNRTEMTHDIAARTSVVTDRLGTEALFQYDENGFVTQADLDGQSTQFTYDERGNKLSQTDARGNTRTFTYDSNDLLLLETDPLGNTVSYTYDSNGHLTSLTDASGNTTQFDLDPNGNVLEISDANGDPTATFVYDANGNPSLITTLGGTTETTYDTFGYVVEQRGPGSLEKSYTYDAGGRKLTETVRRTVDGDILDETTAFAYDPNGHLLSVTDPLGNTTTFTYNGVGQLLTTTDALGNTTSNGYDARGNLATSTSPDGTFEVFGYDLENRRTAHTDPAGRTTFFEYDGRGRLLRTIYPDGSSVVNTHDAVGNRISRTDERGHTTTFEYDANNRLVRRVDPLGNQTLNTYSANGARVSTTDPLGRITQFEYDDNNFGAHRPLRTIFPDGTARQRTYGTSGRPAAIVDEAGNATSFEYEAAGYLASVTNALGNVTTYSYDEAGNLVTQTDPNGNSTLLGYDATGNLIRRTLPEGMSETFSYDAVGNVVAHTDFAGDTTTFAYDSMTRLTTKNLPDGTGVLYTHTATGQLATVTDSRGVTSFSYDLRDRLARVENPDGTSLDYTYDAVGNRTSVSSLAGITTFAFDAANRLTAVTDPEGGATSYTYDGAGNRVFVSYPNGRETHATYDLRNRITAVAHTGTGGIPSLAQYDYTLDPVGNRTRLTETSGRIVDYTYDALFQLISEVEHSGGSSLATVYSYDAKGNRTLMNRGGAITNYTYDANDRLLTAGAEVFTYDANGNQLTRQLGADLTRYEYDNENRLVRMVAPGGTITDLVYDDFGNRIERDVAGSSTTFVVDLADHSGLPQVLAERDGSGAITNSYVYGDDLIRLRQGGGNSYYHYDATGSTRLLTDGTGDVSDEYDYDAYGNLSGSTGTTPNVYLFTGEQLDPGLGLYYLRARYMDPRLGRFLSSDPFQGVLADPRTLHRYAYAGNNPVNMIDPTGEFFSLPGLSVSLAIQGILNTIAISSILYVAYTDAAEIIDEVRTLVDEIPSLKLNEEHDKPTLRERIIRLSLGSDGLDLELDANLGGGSVAKAYDVAASLIGDGGEVVTFVWSYSAGYWMTLLPEVRDGGTDKPAHYLACDFNEYLFRTYQLELLNGVATKPFKPTFQVIGTYLAYLNFLSLMDATVTDFATFTVPPQPADGRCSIPELE
jgi:RHS repeat-associated protein